MSEMSVSTLTALLRHFDWAIKGRNEGLYEVWVQGDERVIVPLDPEKDDFQDLLASGEETVQRRYGRAAQEVIDTLTIRSAASLDATRWHQETLVSGGIIPWQQGEDLFVSARQQLAAAAKSARENRRYHGNSGSYVAKRFLEGSFMGQTAVGSFVITAYTPSDSKFFLSKSAEETAATKGVDLLGGDSVTGTEILDTFERAAKAVRSVLDSYAKQPRIELFAETVTEGVSFEFLRALSLITSSGETSVEIARQALSGAEVPPPVTVAFKALEAQVLQSAAASFAEDPEPQDVTVTGDVTLLERTSEEGAPARLIRLNVAQGAPVRKARVRLSVEQYDLAQEAHKIEGMLRLSGTLEREGHLWWIYNPTNVEVVEPDDVPEPVVDEDGGHGMVPFDVMLEEDDE